MYAPNAQVNCPAHADLRTRNASAGACNISSATILYYNGGAGGNPCETWPTDWPQTLAAQTPELVVLSTGGWEIVDRWVNFPAGPNCTTGLSGGQAFNCTAPDTQWGAGQTSGPDLYRSRLQQVIDLFRSHGSKVLVVNSPFYAPPEAQVPGILLVWYEAYGPTQPTNWQKPNANVSFRPSKDKILELNAIIDDVVAGYASPDVQVFDLWSILSPNGQFATHVGGVKVRENDFTHISMPGFFQVIAPQLLPHVRAMLA